MKSLKQPFYGWWIVGAGGIVQWYTSAVFWRGFQAFVPPILSTFGWSHGATAAAISLQRSESGMISPFVGAFLDKYGPRKVMAFGVFVTGGGCSGFQYAFSVDEIADGDEIIERDGARVAIDAMSLMYLSGSEIDFVDDLIGPAGGAADVVRMPVKATSFKSQDYLRSKFSDMPYQLFHNDFIWHIYIRIWMVIGWSTCHARISIT